MQTIMLDSSFLFPFIQIDVKSVDNLKLLSIIESEKYDCKISDISVFELSSKGNKYINKSLITISDLTDGINAIINEKKISRIPYFYSEVLILANKIAKVHKDYIDCIILSTAYYYSNIFLTLDNALIKLVNKHKTDLDIEDIQIVHWKNFIKSASI